MIKGVGIDITSTLTIGRWLTRYDSATLQTIFTRDELEQCQATHTPAHHLAVCFSSKEAMGKALGTGLATIDWRDIEATFQQDQLVLMLHGRALVQAKALGVARWQASWSHVHDHVMVTVILL